MAKYSNYGLHMYGFYIDSSIHQIGYITDLIRYLDGTLYCDCKSTFLIIRDDFPDIKIKFFQSIPAIIDDMLKNKIKVLILQDFHYNIFSKLKEYGVKFVQIFHGTSDKSYNTNREISKYDLVGLSGTKMLQDTEDKGLNKNKNCIITGNPKTDAIFNNKYDRDSEIKKLGFNPSRKSILYAPTWMDKMGNSSFKKFGLKLPDYFPNEYQLTIKLHPNIYLYKPKLVNFLKNKINGRKNIKLLENKRDIYDIVPIMAASNALITDVSGVSHEYIAFLRPMIFLDNRSIIRFLYGKKRTRIWSAGDVVTDIKMLPGIIRKNIVNPHRYSNIQIKLLKEIYPYTDGKSTERIAEAVKRLVNK